MKKLFLFSLATLALCVTSSAASLTLNCTPAPVNLNGGDGAVVITCPALNPIFFTTLNSVTLTEFYDYAGGTVGITNTVTGVFTPSVATDWTCQSTAGGAAGTSCGPTKGVATYVSSGTTFFSGNTPTGIVTLDSPVNGPFTINVASTLNAGAVQAAVANASVTYTYDTSTSTTPEPSTFALLGSALVGIGMIARRKR